MFRQRKMKTKMKIKKKKSKRESEREKRQIILFPRRYLRKALTVYS